MVPDEEEVCPWPAGEAVQGRGRQGAEAWDRQRLNLLLGQAPSRLARSSQSLRPLARREHAHHDIRPMDGPWKLIAKDL